MRNLLIISTLIACLVFPVLVISNEEAKNNWWIAAYCFCGPGPEYLVLSTMVIFGAKADMDLSEHENMLKERVKKRCGNTCLSGPYVDKMNLEGYLSDQPKRKKKKELVVYNKK